MEGLLAGVRHRVQEIIFVFHFLADVFLGYVRGKADGFFGILHRVRNGPITSPAPHQSIVVGVGNGFVSHDVLHARGEYFVFQRLVKECLDEEVAVAGIKCVAMGHGQFASLIFPSFHFHFGNGAHRAVSQHTLRAEGYGFDVRGLLPVPSFQGTYAAAIAYHQHVIAKAACQLLVVRIKAAFF